MNTFKCSCGKSGTKALGYKITPESKCIDCIALEVEADEPRRKEKIQMLVEKLKQDKILTHGEARASTTTSGLRMDAPEIGHLYLSKLIDKDVPYYNHNLVARIDEDCVVETCLLNALWPWAKYQRDNGGYGYICLIFEPP